jgi:hypothetical protein
MELEFQFTSKKKDLSKRELNNEDEKEETYIIELSNKDLKYLIKLKSIKFFKNIKLKN